MIRHPPKSTLLPYPTLFRSYARKSTAAVYGVGALTSDKPVPVTPPAGQRTGILNQASFPVAYSGPDENDPIRRGKRSEEHTSELQSRQYLVSRLLLVKNNSR